MVSLLFIIWVKHFNALSIYVIRSFYLAQEEKLSNKVNLCICSYDTAFGNKPGLAHVDRCWL